jgi:hypothetical protein
MDCASVDSALNSTVVGPPVNHASLLDGFWLQCARMRGMKAVEQEEEGCLPSRSHSRLPWSRPCPPPSLSREGDHTGHRPTTTAAVAGDLPTTNRRENTRSASYGSVCG